MVLEISDAEKLKNVIKMYESVLVLVYDSRKHEPRYIRMFTTAIAPAFEPEIPVVRVDIHGMSEDNIRKVLEVVEGRLDSLPMLRFFYKGRGIWGQHGLFYRYDVDREALRRGLWISLEAWGLTPRRIGIRFANLL